MDGIAVRAERVDLDAPAVPEIEREVQRVQSTGETITELVTALEDRLTTVLCEEVREGEALKRAHVECQTEMGRRLSGTGDMLDRQVERLLTLLNRISL